MNKQLTIYLTIAVVCLTALLGQRIWSLHSTQLARYEQDMIAEREVNSILASIGRLQGEVQQLEKRMPVSLDTSWMVDLVTRLADRHHLQLNLVEPQKLEDRGRYTKLGVKVGALSTYHAIGEFLSSIENQEKFLRIEAFQIGLPAQGWEAGSDDPVLEVSMIISTASPKTF